MGRILTLGHEFGQGTSGEDFGVLLTGGGGCAGGSEYSPVTPDAETALRQLLHSLEMGTYIKPNRMTLAESLLNIYSHVLPGL